MAAPALPQEVQDLRDKLLRDQAPSARTRSNYFDPSVFASRHARPYSSRRLSIETMMEMRTDALLRFSQLVALVPIFTGKWRIECASAQKAAFVDKALRRIIGRLIVQFYESWNFGYQGIVKEFALMDPGWVYLNKETGKSEPVWDGGPEVPALVWDSFVTLSPKMVMPVWTQGGAFNGIALAAGRAGNLTFPFPTVPMAAGDALGEFGGGGVAASGPFSYSIDTSNMQKVDVDHCSPPDELVLTTNRGPVPIGDLIEGEDRLVVWDKKQKRMNRVRGYDFEKVVRPYAGKLLTISAGGSSTRVTPAHKVTVRWTAEAEEKKAVYLMRKGDWWRIGVAAIVTRKAGTRNSGIAQRVSAEGADAAWVLGIFDTKNDALFHERLWSYQYGIPDMVFRDVQVGRSVACLRTEQLEEIWGQVDSATGARQLLADFGLEERLPLYTHRLHQNRGKEPRGPRGWTCAAVNLVSGMMEVPVDVGRAEAIWDVLSVESEHYEGDVVSLEVPPHHHYVSGSGVIVQNSLWVVNERDSNWGSVWGGSRLAYAYKYWWSYEMTLGILNRSVERKGDPTIVVSYPQGASQIDGVEVSNQVIAQQIGQAARSGAVLTVPSEVWGEDVGTANQASKWRIDYLKAEEQFDKLQAVLHYLDTQKIRSMAISELAFAEGTGGTSSRNVAAVTGERSFEVQVFTQVEWDEIVNRYMIPQLADANFPELRDVPARKVTSTFGQDEAQLAADMLRSIANADPGSLPIDMEALLERFQIDTLSGSALEKFKNDLAAQAEASKPPPTPAEPGGPGSPPKAGVTDTGFYVDAPERIELEDDAMLAALPATRHYADKTVIAQTRLVRRLWKSLLSSAYEDFAKHLESNREDLGLAAGPDELARAAVAAWRFTGDTARVVKATAVALGKVVARAGSLELSASRLKTSFDPSSDDTVGGWVNDNVAALVRYVDKTTRTQLQDFLVARLRDGAQADEIAKGVRSHFAEFPAWRSDMIARTEVMRFYNAGTLFAADAAGANVQALDAQNGPTDPECENRNGRVYPVADAWRESVRVHPRDTLAFRIVPLGVGLARHPREEMGGVAARVDQEERVIHLAEGLDPATESRFLESAVDWLIASG